MSVHAVLLTTGPSQVSRTTTCALASGSAMEVPSACFLPGCQGRPRFCEPSGAVPMMRLPVMRKPYGVLRSVLAAVTAPFGVVPWSSALSVLRSMTTVPRPKTKSTSPSIQLSWKYERAGIVALGLLA
jgi:hypothetical protein